VRQRPAVADYSAAHNTTHLSQSLTAQERTVLLISLVATIRSVWVPCARSECPRRRRKLHLLRSGCRRRDHCGRRRAPGSVRFVGLTDRLDEIYRHGFRALDFDIVGTTDVRYECDRGGRYVEEHGFVGFAARGGFREARVLPFDLDSRPCFCGDMLDVRALGD
jgi:hypothetical protein